MSEETKEVLEEQGGDNPLMSALDEFNARGTEEGSPVGEAETLSTAQPLPEEQESESAIKSVENWLIDNKFKDDDDGKQALAKAYRELQSKGDKDRNITSAEMEKLEKLKKLDGFLKENPGAVKALRGYVDKQEQAEAGPPPKPEDYSMLDEENEESLSAKWRAEYDQWLINQGAQKAIGYVDNLKAQIQANREAEAQRDKLVKIGLSKEQIDDFYKFMKEPKNVTAEHMVEVWKNSRGLVTQGSSDKVPKEAPTTPKQNIVSGASVTGSNPVATTEEKQVEQFWDGIMKHSNKLP